MASEIAKYVSNTLSESAITEISLFFTDSLMFRPLEKDEAKVLKRCAEDLQTILSWGKEK